MHSLIARITLILILVLTLSHSVLAQRPRPKPRATPMPEVPRPDDPSYVPPETQDVDTLKTDTNLVVVPVIATDRGGLYVSDLTKEEFSIEEDGVAQQVAFFAQVSAPFNVVLMLDTSASTEEKLSSIQQAAYTFVQQLQPVDRVKVISFDNAVKELNEFTSNRSILKDAINKTRPGQGTKLYDAMTVALDSLRPIKGRKAIVIFTDGVDWHSDEATYAGTIRWLDEEGVIVYPIRFDTRAATERIAREQANETSPTTLPTSDVLRTPPIGTTAPTFPSNNPYPTSGAKSKTGPLGLPSPEEINRRRRQQDPNRDPGQMPGEDRLPDPPTTTRLPSDMPPGSTRRQPRPDDSISAMLDLAYLTADGYLKALADKSGGKLVRADTVASLPEAFANIAAELRTQYSLGYYPIKKERDDRYRKIKVATTRKDAVIRARPGYLASEAR
jgi:VWFA-related protein